MRFRSLGSTAVWSLDRGTVRTPPVAVAADAGAAAAVDALAALPAGGAEVATAA